MASTSCSAGSWARLATWLDSLRSAPGLAGRAGGCRARCPARPAGRHRLLSAPGRIPGSRGRGSGRPPASAAGRRARPPCCPGSPPSSSARRRAAEPIRAWSSDGHPHVVQHVPQVRGQLVGRDPVPGRAELDVDPGLGYLVRADGRVVVVPADAEDPAQAAGHVPVYLQHRVQQQQDLGLVPVQLGGDRIDQVGHVVGDDVHHQPGPAQRVQVRTIGLADLDHGPALRPAQAEPGVRLGHRGQPRRRG